MGRATRIPGVVPSPSAVARRRLGDRARRSGGHALIYLSIVLLLLLGFASFAVDIGHIHLVETELTAAADAAGRAGGAGLYDPAQPDGGTPDAARASAAAVALAAKNVADGRTVTVLPSDVDVGNWDDDLSPRFVVARTPLNAVRVRAVRSRDRGSAVQLSFAQLFASSTRDVTATAIVKADPPTSPYGFVGIDRVRFASVGVLARVDGDVVSNGDIDIGTPLGLLVGVHGDVRSYKGSVEKGFLANITGATTPLSNRLYFPPVKLPATNDNDKIANRLSGAGDYTTALGWTIPQGTYVVRDLNMLAGIAANVEGPVTFYVSGSVNIAAGVNLFGAANTDASKFKVRVLKGGTVNFLANLLSPIYMDLYAPQSAINIAVGVNHYHGRLVGKTLDIILPVLGRFTEESGLGAPTPDDARITLME